MNVILDDIKFVLILKIRDSSKEGGLTAEESSFPFLQLETLKESKNNKRNHTRLSIDHLVTVGLLINIPLKYAFASTVLITPLFVWPVA